jgi:hypothetical protein
VYFLSVWNIGGWIMFLYARSKSPHCMSDRLKVNLEIVLLFMAVIGAGFFIYLTWVGGSAVFNKLFHNGHTGEVYQVYRALEAQNEITELTPV